MPNAGSVSYFGMRRMDLLIAVYVFCIAAAELMGAKTFPLLEWPFRLNASVAIFTVPLIFSINDIITEVYGKERARSVVRSGLFVIVLLLLYALLTTALPPSSRFASSEAAYDTIFTFSIRMSIASLAAFAISQFFDVYLFARIRQALGASKLWLRNNVSNILAQFVDTVVFIVLAFYSFDTGFGANAAFLWSIILPYWMLKNVMSGLVTPLVYLGVKWLKRDVE
ncbi:queuosine precursor transporter [Candidatus Kaiserbacteria bacterium]|nr:queuosine precursor transporter [Candidatus Kaiserbacteria bacterium]